jgi:hypothetical protein
MFGVGELSAVNAIAESYGLWPCSQGPSMTQSWQESRHHLVLLGHVRTSNPSVVEVCRYVVRPSLRSRGLVQQLLPSACPADTVILSYDAQWKMLQGFATVDAMAGRVHDPR